MFVSVNKLGYSRKETEHIYIGEYLEQFEVYKKYHNMEMSKFIFTEQDEEEVDNEEKLPQWYIDSQKGSK